MSLLDSIRKQVAREPDFVRHIFQEAKAKGTRSTALQSLLWGVGLLLPSIIRVG